MENNYIALAAVDVSKQIEKKQNLSYLSWPFAVDQLMRHDPLANWEFHQPEMYGETMMVSCTVTAFGKGIKMHLPVMDHRNQAVKNPDAFVVNKNMMRCLVKAIACHGLGINVYAGEDLPLDEDGHVSKPAPKAKPAPVKQEEPKQSNAPAKMEGKPGEWQINITADPDTDYGTWEGLVIQTTQIALETAPDEASVMAIFRANKNIYDRMKAEPGATGYDQLLAKFKEARAKFQKGNEE